MSLPHQCLIYSLDHVIFSMLNHSLFFQDNNSRPLIMIRHHSGKVRNPAWLGMQMKFLLKNGEERGGCKLQEFLFIISKTTYVSTVCCVPAKGGNLSGAKELNPSWGFIYGSNHHGMLNHISLQEARRKIERKKEIIFFQTTIYSFSHCAEARGLSEHSPPITKVRNDPQAEWSLSWPTLTGCVCQQCF